MPWEFNELYATAGDQSCSLDDRLEALVMLQNGDNIENLKILERRKINLVKDYYTISYFMKVEKKIVLPGGMEGATEQYDLLYRMDGDQVFWVETCKGDMRVGLFTAIPYSK
ncbi:hypothetical protein KJ564_04740 [bacterium]|nr:hypothetical protein [bacterium]